MRKLTAIEKLFQENGSKWIQPINEYFSEYPYPDMDDEKIKGLESFECCMVGDIRDKLGLSKHYDDYDNVDYCDICEKIAAHIYCSVEDLSDGEYIDNLKQLKIHLKEHHNIKLVRKKIEKLKC